MKSKSPTTSSGKKKCLCIIEGQGMIDMTECPSHHLVMTQSKPEEVTMRNFKVILEIVYKNGVIDGEIGTESLSKNVVIEENLRALEDLFQQKLDEENKKEERVISKLMLKYPELKVAISSLLYQETLGGRK